MVLVVLIVNGLSVWQHPLTGMMIKMILVFVWPKKNKSW